MLYNYRVHICMWACNVPCTVYLYAYVYVYKRGCLIKIMLNLNVVISGLAVVLSALTRGRCKVLFRMEIYKACVCHEAGDECVLCDGKSIS